MVMISDNNVNRILIQKEFLDLILYKPRFDQLLFLKDLISRNEAVPLYKQKFKLSEKSDTLPFKLCKYSVFIYRKKTVNSGAAESFNLSALISY